MARGAPSPAHSVVLPGQGMRPVGRAGPAVVADPPGRGLGRGPPRDRSRRAGERSTPGVFADDGSLVVDVLRWVRIAGRHQAGELQHRPDPSRRARVPPVEDGEGAQRRPARRDHPAAPVALAGGPIRNMRTSRLVRLPDRRLQRGRAWLSAVELERPVAVRVDLPRSPLRQRRPVRGRVDIAWRTDRGVPGEPGCPADSVVPGHCSPYVESAIRVPRRERLPVIPSGSDFHPGLSVARPGRCVAVIGSLLHRRGGTDGERE